MKIYLSFIALIIGQISYAQASDFILLKHKNKTVGTYFQGGIIKFTSNTGAYIEANILKVRNDTLFLREYILRAVPTQMGIYILDTVAVYFNQYHYNQVNSIGKTGRRFDLKGSGSALIGGGAVLLIAGGIVYLVDNKNFSPRLMIGAAALSGLGYLLGRTNGDAMVIGKKYSFLYVQAVAPKRTN